MQVGVSAVRDGAATTRSVPGRGGQIVDFSAFAPAGGRRHDRWRHSIRRVDGRSRLHLPELGHLADRAGGRLSAAIVGAQWMLRAGWSTPWRVAVGVDGRVVVPSGVRRQLQLTDSAVVSAAVDGECVVIWAASRLDDLVGVAQ
jgi:hypothetical protein